jgi:transposase
MMRERLSFMHEFLVQNNVMIYDVKSRNLKRTIQDVQGPLPMSARELILNDKVCEPFWTSLTKEWSKKLWSCTETDLHVSELTYWSTFSRKKDVNSWFTVRAMEPNQNKFSPMICSQSQPYLWQHIMDAEQAKIEKEEGNKKRKKERSNSKRKNQLKYPRTRKIRIYPKGETREKLKQWMGVARKAFNTTTAILQAYTKNDLEARYNVKKEQLKNASLKEGCDKRWGYVYLDKYNNIGLSKVKSVKDSIIQLGRNGFNKIRDHKTVFNHIDGKVDEWLTNPWISKVPCYIYDNAIRQVGANWVSNKAANEEKRKKGEKVKRSDFSFKSKKDEQTIEINKRDWNGTCAKIRELKPLIKCEREKLPEQVECSVKIKMDKMGRFWCSYTNDFEEKSENQAPSSNKHSVAALDPGVRTFQTIYDVDGQSIEWGMSDIYNKIQRLGLKADKIQSKMATMKRRKTCNGKKTSKTSIRKAYLKKLNKIRQYIDECQDKLSLFLCENYRIVMIPEFKSSNMVNKATRSIGSKTVRSMMTWAHYRFRQKLITKSKLYPWCHIIVVNESYTSKTCSECGSINNVGSCKVYYCPDCEHRADRDVNAARNILLRYLSKYKLACN